MGTYGKKIKELRSSKRISQRELSEVLDISPATISRYEKELIEPTEEVIVKTAIYFGVSTDYLLGLTSCPKVHSDVIKNYEIMKEKIEKFDSLLEIMNDFTNKKLI